MSREITGASLKDEQYMRHALEEARRAQQHGEVPVGAVLISPDGIELSRTHNNTIGLCDPTAHAEILALRQAANILKNYRLVGTILYVTIEPCPMCMGALIQARVARLVFGAPDLKGGAAGTCFDLSADVRLNHRIEVTKGILEDECRLEIQNFFKIKRANSV